MLHFEFMRVGTLPGNLAGAPRHLREQCGLASLPFRSALLTIQLGTTSRASTRSSFGTYRFMSHVSRIFSHQAQHSAFAPRPNWAFNRDVHASHGRPLTFTLGRIWKCRCLSTPPANYPSQHDSQMASVLHSHSCVGYFPVSAYSCL